MPKYRFCLCALSVAAVLGLAYVALEWADAVSGTSDIASQTVAADIEPVSVKHSTFEEAAVLSITELSAERRVKPKSEIPLPLDLVSYKHFPVDEPPLFGVSAAPGAKGDPDTDPDVWPKPTPKPGHAAVQAATQGQWGHEASSPAISFESGGSETYTWKDGDRDMTVALVPGLVASQVGPDFPEDQVVAQVGLDSIVPKTGKQDSDAKPVFRSAADGSLMTLPGGVLLALDESWDQVQIDAFYVENDIDSELVTPLEYLVNTFLVQTQPGIPSLDLANRLAILDGVEVSSPNWWQERDKR